MSVFKNIEMVKDFAEAIKQLYRVLLKHPIIDPVGNSARVNITNNPGMNQIGILGYSNGNGVFVSSYGSSYLPARDTTMMFTDRQCYYQLVRTRIGDI